MTLGPLLLLSLTALPSPPLAPGDHVRTVRIGAVERAYNIHIPPGLDPSKPAPVVLVLHSAAMNGESMAKFCGLSEKADQAGFIAVYPNGTGVSKLFLYWDAGGVRGRVSDDVGYIARVLDDLATVVRVDPRRVYAAGMSNGAMMCHRLAAELSDRIAAIATVAGTLALEEFHPRRPVPVLHFHGTKDGLVLFDGPDERIPENLKFLSVAETGRTWARANGCPETPVVTNLPDRVDDGTVVKRTRFGPGKDGSEVILYAIEGGGHTWPGREPRIPFLGKSTREIAANDLIWEFFQAHPMAGKERVTLEVPPVR